MITLRSLSRFFVLGMLGMAFGVETALAEKLDCTGTGKSKQQISFQDIKPGDRPDHFLAQLVAIDSVSSKNPELDGAERKIYGHIDGLAAYGSHSGYSTLTLKSGETLWDRYEGVGYTIGTFGVGDWEIRSQGVFQFVAGTGKYKAIRGGGYYSGRFTPAGGTVETLVCDAEY